MHQLIIVKVLIIILTTFQDNHAEVFSATDDMEQFHIIENEMIKMLKTQIDDYESKLKILKLHHANYVAKHEEAARDIQAYLGNPITAFQLTKRITVDWEKVKKDTEPVVLDENGLKCGFCDIDNEIMKAIYIAAIFSTLRFHNKSIELATKEDLTGAALALARLQETYHLHPKFLAKGVIRNHQYNNSSMTGSDCYQLALQLSSNKKYQTAGHWYEEALKRFDDTTLSVSKDIILGELALMYSLSENYMDALTATLKLIEIVPFDDVARKNKKVLEEIIKSTESDEQNNLLNAQPESTESLKDRLVHYDSSQDEAYKRLCRNELQQTPKQQALLQCKYITNNVPFLKIGPIKMEEASLDPYIVTFHNVLYESEMAMIKFSSKPSLERALVEDFQNNVSLSEKVEYRISKSSWIEDFDYDFIRVINQRIEDMTKTSMSTAEPLQIVNYGIGGQYEPHFDFALNGDLTFDEAGNGNRIATLMFYMSDVDQGGATVFPLINIAVWPQKGSAIFWWNLFASGGLDYRTKHAGCPVLVGSKWVSNKWIHEKGQEFLRPCKLTLDDNNSNVQFI